MVVFIRFQKCKSNKQAYQCRDGIRKALHLILFKLVDKMSLGPYPSFLKNQKADKFGKLSAGQLMIFKSAGGKF